MPCLCPFAQRTRSAKFFAILSGGVQSGLDPIPDQTPLEFSKRAKNMEDQFTGRAGGVDTFRQRLKTNPALLKVDHDVNHML